MLITGATRNHGRASALAFAEEGAHLLLCTRQSMALLEETAHLAAPSGVRIVTGRCDVTDEDMDVNLHAPFLSGDSGEETSEAAVYVVSYIEVIPSSTDETIMLLRQYRRASRKEAGNRRLEVLQQHGRPDHFALVEAWQDQQSFAAHGRAAHTTQLCDRLQPLRVSPFDERLH